MYVSLLAHSEYFVNCCITNVLFIPNLLMTSILFPSCFLFLFSLMFTAYWLNSWRHCFAIFGHLIRHETGRFLQFMMDLAVVWLLAEKSQQTVTKLAQQLGSVTMDWSRWQQHMFNSHFPGQPEQVNIRMSPIWILLQLRIMQVVVTTGAIRRAKLQSNRHKQQTNTQNFTCLMPFLLPNQQCQSIEGKSIAFDRPAYPKLNWGLQILTLPANGSWLPWREGCQASSVLQYHYPMTICSSQFTILLCTESGSNMHIEYGQH